VVADHQGCKYQAGVTFRYSIISRLAYPSLAILRVAAALLALADEVIKILLHLLTAGYGTNLLFRSVHCTAASGGNPDIEPTSPDDRVRPNPDVGRRKACIVAGTPQLGDGTHRQ
jgi:hypothetical protein